MTDMLKDIDACIFDFDGTLVDSMWVWTAIDEEYFEKYNLTEPEDFHEGIEGKSYTETAQYFVDAFPELPLTRDEVMDEWTRMAYDKYMTEVLLKEGAADFLKKLRSQGKKLGIATSNTKELVTDALKALGIDGCFDAVCTACEAKKGKPAPDVYLMAARKLGAEPFKCMVFEDVPMGILAGKNAGMKTCAVRDEFSRPQEERKKELSDYYIRDYRDIINGTYEVLLR